MKAAAGSEWTYAGIDPTPAPGGRHRSAPRLNRSLAHRLDRRGPKPLLASSPAPSRTCRSNRPAIPGLMIPVLEETTLTRRWTEGRMASTRSLRIRPCALEVSIPFRCLATRARLRLRASSAMWRRSRSSGTNHWRRDCYRRQARAGEMTEFSGALANAIIQPLPGSSRQ
ncbi:MAG: hypothetical protein Udaeo2_32020 [Candidatus Udaeobacter sp.]|nr:MAG: hypothetical protein Udaeo2_32020 [Candidatus Udaeobacter sp.]